MKLNKDIAGYAFGDTETTGVSFIRSNIIEIAFVLDDPYCNTLESFQMNVNLPYDYVWEPEAEAIHGISEQEAKTHGVSQIDAIHRMNAFFVATYGTRIHEVKLVGANSFFDFVMLQNMYETHNAGRVPFSYRLIDINQAGLFVGAGNLLSDICEHYSINVDETQKHGAMYDAILHRTTFKHLIQDLQIC